jgi:hypothetical protein
MQKPVCWTNWMDLFDPVEQAFKACDNNNNSKSDFS